MATWAAALISLQLFAAAPESDPAAALLEAAQSQEPPSLDVYHSTMAGEGMRLIYLKYVVDGGAPVLVDGSKDGKDPNDGLTPVHHETISPGVHVILLEATYEGRSGMFSYVDNFRFTFRGRAKFKVGQGEAVTIQTRLFKKDGVTVTWEERPYISLQGAPRRLILEMEVLQKVVQRIPEVVAVPEKPMARPVPEPVPPEPPPPPPVAVAQAAPQPVEAKPTLAEPPQPSVPTAPAKNPPPAPQHAPSIAAAQSPRLPPECKGIVIHFTQGRAQLTPSAMAALDALGDCLAAAPDFAIELDGHCDSTGSNARNEYLGELRARAAAAELAERGVSADRIRTVSFGERRPVCPERTRACYARNRRVETLLQPALTSR